MAPPETTESDHLATRPGRAGRLRRVLGPGPRHWPVVTAALAAAVLAVGLRYGVFAHELPATAALRFGFSGRRLAAGDWRTLLTSQLLSRDGFMATSIVLSLVVMMGLYEVVAGHLRAAVVAGTTAAAGPILTATAAGLGSAFGSSWAAHALSTIDYGASAVTAGAGGALVAVLHDRRLRVGAALWVLGGLVVHHQLADWEHLFSFVVGFGLGWLLGRPRQPHPVRLAKRWLALPPLVGRTCLVASLAGAVLVGASLGPLAVPARATVAVTGVTAASVGVPSGSPVSPPRVLRLTYRSAALGARRGVLVMLPPGYDDSQARYPVVEMLHGSPGSPQDMFGLLDVAGQATSGRLRTFIAVAPDGNVADGHETDFADTSHLRLGTAVSVDLQRFVDARFRTDGTWGVMGISSGAYAASQLASSHPDLYRSLCAMSGYFTAAAAAFRGESTTTRDAASPLLHARRDGPPTLLVAGAGDRHYATAATAYDAALRRAGQPHQLVLVPHEGHDWALWNRELARCLTWVLDPSTHP